MSQRLSGYAREAYDKYQTPPWVTRALVPHIPSRVRVIWEPAAGDGYMADALRASGYDVGATDLQDGFDFLSGLTWRGFEDDAIITNPPYEHGQKFCEKALVYMSKPKGFIAMLLRIDFDSAKTRRHLFANSPHWSKKIVLLDRIRWEGIEQHTASPSYNHAWYCWDYHHTGPASIAYAAKAKMEKYLPLLEEAA